MRTAISIQWILSVALAGALTTTAPVVAQVVSGSIGGVVLDSQKAAVPGAQVTLSNQAERATVREVRTSGEGTFVITPVLPGTFTLTVEAPGFKLYSSQDIVLHTGDKLGLPPIELEIGSTGDSITVQADPVALQTASAERSGVVTATQVKELALVGRNFLELMKTVPGVSPDNVLWVNGQRNDSMSFSVDGVTVMDIGASFFYNLRVNTDNIAEFKLLTNSQQAEFGRSSGIHISVVTKSGTRDFHGTGYWFLRNESLNANSWDRNYYGLPRSIYRYRTQGFNVSGPIYVPGKFNTNRNRLFFFASAEFQRPRVVDELKSLTVPTVRERQGDFSATHDASGMPVPIVDPLNGRTPFPNNRIPQARWHPLGEKALRFFPEPNKDGLSPTFNYQFQFEGKYKNTDELYRVDHYIHDNWRFFFRLLRNDGDYWQNGAVVSVVSGISGLHLPTGAIAGMGNLTTTISPTLTNEFSFGNLRSWFPIDIESDSKFLRSVSGLTLPVPYPNANPAGLMAGMVFGGLTANANPPNIIFRGIPFDNENFLSSWADNLSKVFARHTLKAGLYIENSLKRTTAWTYDNGVYYFNRDSLNPGDANWDFANALLGTFRYFEQADAQRIGYYVSRNFEWYIQDNWKLRPNLTLDFGMRFVLMPNMYDRKNQLAGFNPAMYDPSQQVRLLQKAWNPATGQRASYNPVTGQYGPEVLVGTIVPGVGNVDNGIVQAGRDYPRALIDDRGVQYAPRVGLAWTPAGLRGKMVVRMGGGVFYERTAGNLTFPLTLNPPIIRRPSFYYGSFSTFNTLSQTLSPATVGGTSRDGKVPAVYNYSLGVQKQLPFSFLLDVSYVGSLSRHLPYQLPWNTPPWGSAWLPQYQDPTVAAPKYDGTTTLPVNFTRPYIGYGGEGTFLLGGGYTSIFGGCANYNSLQISANRRMSRTLLLGVAYTWSKALGTADSLSTAAHPTDTRKADYGPLSYDRTQILNVNYTLNLPDGARKGTPLGNALGRIILNGWQISGITSLSSGAPGTIAYSQYNTAAVALNRMITGSEPMAPRVILTGTPNLSPGDRTLHRWIDTSVVRPAVKGSQGMDSGPRNVRGPGVNNWDISVFKRIRFTSNEQRYVQLRLEMFNAFNHTQWSSVNLNAQFDAAGNITNLPSAANRFGFGALNFTSTNPMRPPRQIQVAVKVYF
ncbi:MAG: carboxypeptidase regulatory-like domain-containing protein [Bryobacteraceae bacterium]